MPEQFKFVRTNSTVTKALSRNEILAVTVWQDGASDFQFEFHTQHEAGWPCYLREPDGPNRGLPKLNLKGDAWTGTLLQPGEVRDQDKSQEFQNVITANLEAFRKMAQAFLRRRRGGEHLRSGLVREVFLQDGEAGKAGLCPHPREQAKPRRQLLVQESADEGDQAELPDAQEIGLSRRRGSRAASGSGVA